MADEEEAGANLPATRGETKPLNLPIVVMKSEPTHHPVAGREMLRNDAGDVRADHLAMEKSGAESVEADRVSMVNSGAKSVEAKSVQADNSGVLSLKSDNTVLLQSSAVAVLAKSARLTQSAVVLLKADTVELDPESKVLLHVGPAASGSRPAFGVTEAAAFGAAFGAVVLVVGSLLRRIFR